MNHTLLDPRNDLVFKMLFANSLPLLTDLINAVRGNEAPIVVVSVQNPRIDAEDCYDLFANPKQVVWCFEMRDRINPAMVLGPEIQLNIVELKKADRLASFGDTPGTTANSTPAGLSALAAWITYFAHWKEENIMNQIAYPPVLEALQQLKALSADDETRRLAEVRERAMMSESTEIEAALARGKDIGKEIGKEIGAAQAKAEALRCLIESGIPEAQARAILHM